MELQAKKKVVGLVVAREVPCIHKVTVVVSSVFPVVSHLFQQEETLPIGCFNSEPVAEYLNILVFSTLEVLLLILYMCYCLRVTWSRPRLNVRTCEPCGSTFIDLGHVVLPVLELGGRLSRLFKVRMRRLTISSQSPCKNT